ncbi:MAG: hypothetical protein HKN47_20090 [Pirellulaceae bacterium]|nr:hypothetical protein [Pirellulaceae bacterium]
MSDRQASHYQGLTLLLLPGLLLCSLALLVDVVRGLPMVAAWGSGQSVLLVLGVMMGIGGVLLHRKAVRDETRGVRKYARTVAFVLAPLTLLVVVPILIAELSARLLPEPSDTSTSYRQSDPRFGFSIAPDRHYRVVSRPKDFDIQIRIDGNGNRRDAGDAIVDVDAADIVVVGDSHPFGFGVAEDNTLSAHLSNRMRDAGHRIGVLNAGVPGFGIGQTLLRIRSFDRLRPGAIIVVFVNPLNDLVNVSSSVDYHYPKPYPVLDNQGNLVFRDAPTSWGEGPFLFSPSFESLNAVFGLEDQRRFYHSALYRRLTQSSMEPEVVDGVTMLVDETSVAEFLAQDAQRITNQPLLYASRYWPEIEGFADEREKLQQLTRAVFAEMAKCAEERRWHLVVIVAPEARHFQTYSQRFQRQVQAVVPDMAIGVDWSRQAVLKSLEPLQDSSAMEVVAIDYGEGEFADTELEGFFLQNDDHTSGSGHRVIAREVADVIIRSEWIDHVAGD